MFAGHCLLFAFCLVGFTESAGVKHTSFARPEAPLDATERAKKALEEEKEKKVEWSYDNATGWGSLKVANNMCGVGRTQSPIDIETKNTKTSCWLESLDFSYVKQPAMVANPGFTAKIFPQNPEGIPDSHLAWNKMKYTLLQASIHSPSEHKIDGKFSAAELQLHHVGTGGQFLITSVFMENLDGQPCVPSADDPLVNTTHDVFGNMTLSQLPDGLWCTHCNMSDTSDPESCNATEVPMKSLKGKSAVNYTIMTPDNAFLSQYWDTVIGLALGKTKDLADAVDFNEALPPVVNKTKGYEYFFYWGSMTTPPCREDVMWIVMKSPLRISARQISDLQVMLKDGNVPNARPVQSQQPKVGQVYSAPSFEDMECEDRGSAEKLCNRAYMLEPSQHISGARIESLTQKAASIACIPNGPDSPLLKSIKDAEPTPGVTPQPRPKGNKPRAGRQYPYNPEVGLEMGWSPCHGTRGKQDPGCVVVPDDPEEPEGTALPSPSPVSKKEKGASDKNEALQPAPTIED